MKSMDVYTLGTEELEATMNQVMGVTLHFLYKNKYIDESTYLDLNTNYAIILRRPTFFSKAWDMLKGKKETPHIIIVKQQNLETTEDDEPNKKPKIKKEGQVIIPDFKNGKEKEDE